MCIPKIFFVAAFLFSSLFVFAQPTEVNVIPVPASVVLSEGVFRLTPQTFIVADGKMSKSDAEVFNELVEKLYGFRLNIVDSVKAQDGIILISSSGNLKKDEYNLAISPSGVTITGNG